MEDRKLEPVKHTGGGTYVLGSHREPPAQPQPEAPYVPPVDQSSPEAANCSTASQQRASNEL